MGSKLSLSFTLSTPLRSKRSTLPSVQLSRAWIKRSDKTDQDFKVGISNEDYWNNTNSEADWKQPKEQGLHWLDISFYFFFKSKYLNKWDKRQSLFHSMKHCYLSSCVVFFCNFGHPSYSTQTPVTGITIKRMLENKIHLTWRFVCFDIHLQKWPFRIEVTTKF